jgi:hypothetical protein
LEADAHCLSKSPWAFCEVDQGWLAAAKPHEMNSIQRLKCAQQDAGPNPASFAADVYEEV